MKLITDIKDDVEFLKALYNCVPVIDSALKESSVMNVLRRKAPVIVAGEGLTVEQVEGINKKNREIIREQRNNNVKEALRLLMVEKPECTVDILHSLIVLDEGEKYPTGPRLITTAFLVVTNEDILDFFGSLIDMAGLMSRDV